MSNKLDKEVKGRKPLERPHREVVGTAVVNGKLFSEIVQGEERVRIIKAFLVFAVAAFHLAIVSGSVRTNQFVADPQLGGGLFEKGLQISFTVGKTVGKLKAVVGLNTFNMDSFAGVHLVRRFRKSAEE